MENKLRAHSEYCKRRYDSDPVYRERVLLAAKKYYHSHKGRETRLHRETERKARIEMLGKSGQACCLPAVSEDCAYAAGIIDGEGCIHIARRLRKGKPFKQYQLAVSVHIADREIVEWLAATFGGGVSKHSPPVKREWSQMYRWDTTTGRSETLLRLILPWLKIKRTQAQLGLEFQSTLQRGKRLQEGDLERQAGYYWRLRQLKRTNRPFAEALIEHA